MIEQPHSLEAEQVIAGAVMVEPRVLDDFGHRLTADDFYTPKFGLIYGTALSLYSIGEAPEPVLVVERLKQDGTLKAAGGVATVMEAAESVVTTANLSRYVDLVLDYASLRVGYLAATRAAAKYLEKGADFAAVTGELEGTLLGATREESEDISMPEAIERTMKRYVYDTRQPGIPTGIKKFDAFLPQGLSLGSLTILAARPSIGKTSVGMQIARDCGHPVTVFSLEQEREELVARYLSAEAKIPMHELGPNLKPDDLKALVKAREVLAEVPIKIYDNRVSKLTQIASLTRRQARRGCRLFIVDYLGLMDGSGKESRDSEIGEITRGIKALAKEVKGAFVVLAQLNRRCEAREDKRPMLSDLRDSGNIEQDADRVVFLYRDNYYNPTHNQPTMEMIVAKNRNGPLGKIIMDWNAEQMRVYDPPGWVEGF